MPRFTAILAVLFTLVTPAFGAEPPVTAPTDWPLTFRDDFDHLDVSRLDASPWTALFPWGGHYIGDTKEEQYYVEPRLGLNPFSIKNGVLTITADRAATELGPRTQRRQYTSGLLTSYRSFSQLYGYFEMRAKLPPGRGLWPAFWLLPTDLSWPPEVDVVETVGDPGKLYVTVHYGKTDHRGFPVQVPDTTTAFHTYGTLWTPSHIAWYFDHKRVAVTVTPTDMHQKKMYLLIDLAVGGTWAGSPTPQTPFPARLQISYIRAYRLPDDMSIVDQSGGG
jgi:beta-glucanase (GH16 family)